jgi:pRiA4b ORF-3-like protein
MTRLLKTRGNAPLYQIKITLAWSDPPIWRRVIVPADMTLNRFHDVIQWVMGWTDSHLHQFVVGKTFYGKPDPEFADMGSETLSEKRYTIADLAPAAKKNFVYEYDFGDGWCHKIVVEKVLPPDPALKHPVCVAGANACPPEDCGGIGGYYELLAAVADPRHPEHENVKEWIGGEWDAARFDLEETNAILKRIRA